MERCDEGRPVDPRWPTFKELTDAWQAKLNRARI
jgi:hypothetical protein